MLEIYGIYALRKQYYDDVPAIEQYRLSGALGTEHSEGGY